MDQFVKEMGFNDHNEFNKLISSVDLQCPLKMEKFIKWKESDGTKQGLLKLIN